MKKFEAMPDEEDYIPEEEELPEEDGQEENEELESESVFPEEHLEPLRGLLFVGAISKVVEVAGHEFLLRTLKEGEILRIGQLLSKYKDTPVEAEARRMLTVAASIESVDGYPVGEPYKEGYDGIYTKAQQVKEWYPAVIADLYSHYLDIEGTAVAVSRSLKKS